MVDDKKFLEDLKNDLYEIIDEYADDAYVRFTYDFKTGRVVPRSSRNDAWLYCKYRGWTYAEESNGKYNNVPHYQFLMKFSKDGEDDILVLFETESDSWSPDVYINVEYAHLVKKEEVTVTNVVRKYK